MSCTSLSCSGCRARRPWTLSCHLGGEGHGMPTLSQSCKPCCAVTWRKDGNLLLTRLLNEPPLTCSLTTMEVRHFLDSPMAVPAWPSHTQSVERLVKRVTEASSHLFNHERMAVHQVSGGQLRADAQDQEQAGPDQLGQVQEHWQCLKFEYWLI